jgi:hypothetical protein
MQSKYLIQVLFGVMFIVLFGLAGCESTQMRESQAVTGDTDYDEDDYEYIEERSAVPDRPGPSQSMHGRGLQYSQ